MITYNELVNLINCWLETKEILQRYIPVAERYKETMHVLICRLNEQEKMIELMERELLAELAQETITGTQKIISVYYETNYKWSVSIAGEDESRACGLNKAEAVALAKEIRLREGGELNIQTLTREEKKQAMCDRWQIALELGWNKL